MFLLVWMKILELWDEKERAKYSADFQPRCF